MSRSAPPAVALLAAALALVVAAPSLAAQERPHRTPPRVDRTSDWRLDARGGIAIPTADLRDYVDEGPVLGAGVARRIAPRLSARLDWTAALMRPADRRPLRSQGVDIPAEGSETDLHHVTAGLQYSLSEPGRPNVEVRAHAGAGVTFLSTEATALAEGGDFRQFTVVGGLELAVPLGRDVRLVGRGDVHVLPFRSGAPSHLLREVTLPVSAGLAVGL